MAADDAHLAMAARGVCQGLMLDSYFLSGSPLHVAAAPMQFVDQFHHIATCWADEAQTLTGKPRKGAHVAAGIAMAGC